MTEAEEKKISDKIDKYWEDYRGYTDKLSDICRQLAFAEGGVFWMLMDYDTFLPITIVFGLLTLTCFFISEALQYFFGEKDYYLQAKKFEQKLASHKHIELDDVQKRYTINIRARFFYHLKLVFLVLTSLILSVKFVLVFMTWYKLPSVLG